MQFIINTSRKEGVLLKVTEENFIEQMKKRNEKSLEYLIDNYAWVIKSVLKKHLYHLMDYYDECMNDCLLSIWENIYHFNPEKSSFKNWIGKIAKYKSIDYARKYLKELNNQNIEDLKIPIEDLSLKEILTREISEETEKMLSKLSKEDREIFIKFYFKEMTIDEISKDTGFSKPILYNRLSRGKKKLRRTAIVEGGYNDERC